MRLFTTIVGLRCYLERYRNRAAVGFVPTMGALHVGHLSLIERACRENDVVVVSIFVNPLQFGPSEDFQSYPQQLEQDCQLCEQAGVDAVFAPCTREMFPPRASENPDAMNYTLVVAPATMTSVLCGRFRPTHFQGVATVVLKLLNLVQPQRAYFGQKDAQQLAIIQRLVSDLNIPVTIVGCPIVREASGLAYSSRNKYLTEAQKAKASILYKGLHQARQAFQSGQCDANRLIEIVKSELSQLEELQVEYVELVHPKTLEPLERVDESGLLALATHLGKARLIDNVLLKHRKPVVAIDGPAGAGKSTVTREVARSLGLVHLNTGAMYRAVTWRVLQAGIELDDEPAIAELVSQSHIYLTTDNSDEATARVLIDGEDVTEAIRSLEVTANVSAIAAQAVVRQELVKQQQRWGDRGGIIAEGRDIGTHVFPNAELKIFLTASVQERARRRLQDLNDKHLQPISLEQLEKDIIERDFKDSTRSVAPLRKADDAIEIITDGFSIAEVTEKIVALYHQRVQGYS